MTYRKAQNSNTINTRKYIVIESGDAVLIECNADDLAKEIIETWDIEYVGVCTVYDITNLSPMKLKASYTLS